MRAAVITDIRSNVPALDAALRKIDERGVVDVYSGGGISWVRGEESAGRPPFTGLLRKTLGRPDSAVPRPGSSGAFQFIRDLEESR